MPANDVGREERKDREREDENLRAKCGGKEKASIWGLSC